MEHLLMFFQLHLVHQLQHDSQLLIVYILNFNPISLLHRCKDCSSRLISTDLFKGPYPLCLLMRFLETYLGHIQ